MRIRILACFAIFLAISLPSEAQKSQLKDPNYFLSLADSTFKAGDARKALRYARKAIKNADEKAQAREQFAIYFQAVADSFLEENRPDIAQLYFEEKLRIQYDLKKGMLKERNKRFLQGMSAVPAEELVEVSEQYEFLGDYFMNVKKYPSAYRAFEKMQMIAQIAGNAPQQKLAIIRQGEAYLEMGNQPAALRKIREALGNDSQIVPTANDYYCQAAQQGDIPAYGSAARLYAIASLLEENAQKDNLALLSARSYWEARNIEKSFFWYSQLITEKQINRLLASDTIIQVHVKPLQCDDIAKQLQADAAQLLTNEDYFHYAQAVLNGKGKYLTAKQLIYKFNVSYEALERDAYPFIPLISKTYLIKKLPFPYNQSHTADFSPAYAGKGRLVFVSDRTTEGEEKVDQINDETRTTTELFVAQLDAQNQSLYELQPAGNALPDSLASRLMNLKREVVFNEGPLAFFPGSSDHLIFTGNSFDSLNTLQSVGNGINTLKLYDAFWNSQQQVWQVKPVKFTGPNAVYFNSGQYSVGHPTFSQDGKRLYFSSDAPFGLGKSDLYYSDYDAERQAWGNPINLGGMVNSEANDVFPFVYTAKDGTELLYFSSNRGGGLGGLDLYETVMTSNGFSSPFNLQDENIREYTADCQTCINSPQDDFGLTLNPEGSFGFFSSDRDSTDDIYKFRIFRMDVLVLDKDTKQPIEGAEVVMKNHDENLETRQTPANGWLSYQRFRLFDSYDFHATAPFYRSGQGEIFTYEDKVGIEGIFRDTIYLEKSPVADLIVLANVKSEQQVFIRFDRDVTELTNDAVLLKNHLYEITYENGRNIIQDTKTNTSSVPIFYFGSFELRDLDNETRREGMMELIRQHNLLVNDPVVIRNIRYNFATSNYGKDVSPKEEFAKAAQIMHDNPQLYLKLSSHTDRCPLDGNYDNKALSGRRNARAFESITQSEEHPVDASRLRLCAFTYEFPVDNQYGPDGCKNDYNRRTEFKFLYKHRKDYDKDASCNPDVIYYEGKDDQSSIRSTPPSIKTASTTGGK